MLNPTFTSNRRGFLGQLLLIPFVPRSFASTPNPAPVQDPRELAAPEQALIPVRDELDERGKLFADTKLYEALQGIEVPFSEQGFPKWNSDRLARLIEAVRKNPEDIGRGFRMNLSKIDGKIPDLQISHAISFGPAAGKELNGSTYLLIKPSSLNFNRDDRDYSFDDLALRVYPFRYKRPDGTTDTNLQLRLNDSTRFTLSEGASISPEGRVEGGTATLTVGFIGSPDENAKKIFEIIIDPEATKVTTIVGEPKDNKQITEIRVPASAVQIHIPKS